MNEQEQHEALVQMAKFFALFIATKIIIYAFIHWMAKEARKQ